MKTRAKTYILHNVGVSVFFQRNLHFSSESRPGFPYVEKRRFLICLSVIARLSRNATSEKLFLVNYRGEY